MQKKVLLPILMAAPVAFPAFANISFDAPTAEDWDQLGVSGETNLEGGHVTVAGGYVKTSLGKLPVGTYILTLKSANRAICIVNPDKVEGAVIGKGIEEVDNTGLVYKFQIEEPQEVTLYVTSDDPSIAFDFEIDKLELEFDANDAYNEAIAHGDIVKAGLEAISLNDADTAPTFDEGDKLRAEIAGYKEYFESYNIKRDDKVIGDLESFEDAKNNWDSLSTEEQLDIYIKFGYDREKDFITEFYDDLAYKIYGEDNEESLKARVEAENAAFDKYLENKAAFEAYKTEYESLTNQFGDVEEFIATLADAAQKKEYQKSLEVIKGDAKDVWEKICGVYNPEGDLYNWREDIEIGEEFVGFGGVEASLDELTGDLKKANEDWADYYAVNFELIPELKTLYETLGEKGETSGIKGHEENFVNWVKDTLDNGGQEIYDKAIECFFTNVEGAAASGKKAIVENAIAAFKQYIEELKNLADEQNGKMEKALGLLNGTPETAEGADDATIGYNGELAAHDVEKGHIVPTSYQKEHKKLFDEANDAIEAFKEHIEESYKAYELYADEYGTLKQAVEDALKALTNMEADGTFKDVAELQKALDDVKGEVAEMGSIGERTLSNLFDGTFKNFQNVIDNFTKDSDGEVDKLIDEIWKIVDDADKLKGYYGNARDILDGLGVALIDFKESIKNKKIEEVPELDLTSEYFVKVAERKEDAEAEYAAFEAPKRLLESELSSKLLTENPQKLYEELKAFYEKLIATDITIDKAEIDAATLKFEQDVTGLNFEYIRQYVNENMLESPETDFPGADGVNDKFQDVLDEVVGLEEEYGKIDFEAEIAEVIKEIGVIDNTINVLYTSKVVKALEEKQKVLDNKEAYDALVDGIGGLNDKLEEERGHNEKDSLKGAIEFFDKVIDDIQKKIDKLDKDVYEAYNNIKAAEEAEKFDAQVKAIDEEIDALCKWIKANNEGRQDLLNKAAEVSKFIGNLITELEAEQEEAGLKGADIPALQEWIDLLNSYLTNSTDPKNILDVNTHAYQAYSEGMCVNEKVNEHGQFEEIMAEYDKLLEAAQAIAKEFTGDAYHDAVVKANDATTDGWEQTVADLTQLYLYGIAAYNYFYYTPGFNNEGWKARVEEDGILKRHENLQQYYKRINDLRDEIQNFIDEANGVAEKDGEHTHSIIAEAEWKLKLKTATDLEEEITAAINDFLDEMDRAANDYYDKLDGKYHQLYTQAIADLKKQGIPTTFLYQAEQWYMMAETVYNGPAVAPDDGAVANNLAVEHKSARMDGVADFLDNAIASFEYDTWAAEQWSSEYADAKEAVRDAKATVNGKDCEFAEKDVIDAWREQIGQIKEAIEALNEQYGESGNFDNFDIFSDALDGLLENLQSAVDEVKKSSDNNKESKDAYDKFQADIQTIDDLFNGLREYVEGLAGCAGVLDTWIDGIDDTITKLKAAVEKNQSNLASWDPSVEDFCNCINDAIYQGYEAARDAEFRYLTGTLYPLVQASFNDAYEQFMSGESLAKELLPEGYETWQEYFDAIDARIKEFALIFNGYEEDGKLVPSFDNIWAFEKEEGKLSRDEWAEQAQEYEKDLCGIYAELQSFLPEDENPNVVRDALERLEKAAEATEEALKEAQDALDAAEYLSEEEKAEYQSKLDELSSNLEAEKASWTEEGDWVIAREGHHTAHLGVISAEADDLRGDLNEANDNAKLEAERKAANDAAYERLTGEYSELAEQWEAVKAEVAAYGYEEQFEAWTGLVDEMLEKALEALEAANGSLNAGSTLQDKGAITWNMNRIRQQAALQYTAALVNETVAARTAASDALKGNIVPEVKVEQATLFVEASAELNELINGLTTRTSYETLKEYMEKAQELTERFNAIAEAAVESTYIVGDVNLDSELSIADVQKLISFIGKGTTYADLYEEDARQACAADITGNQLLDIADVTSLFDILINEDTTAHMLRIKAANASADASSTIAVNLVEELDGVRRYAVVLSNGCAFRGGQMDIKVSGNARVVGVEGTVRTENHDIYQFDNVESTRIIVASAANAVIADNNGEILFIDVEGAGSISIDGIVFADNNNVAHRISGIGTSGINNVIDTIKGYGERIYDAAGRMYNRLQRGINIIRHSDGSVTKEIRE